MARVLIEISQRKGSNMNFIGCDHSVLIDEGTTFVLEDIDGMMESFVRFDKKDIPKLIEELNKIAKV